jgi:hypothetical protein
VVTGRCPGWTTELLMTSGTPLETCWAFNKFWNNKFYYKVASCWLFLLIQNMSLLICLSCRPSCPVFPRLIRVLFVLFYRPELNLMLETFLQICTDFATTLFLETVFSDAMPLQDPHGDCARRTQVWRCHR